jgi:hypothetical protein
MGGDVVLYALCNDLLQKYALQEGNGVVNFWKGVVWLVWFWDHHDAGFLPWGGGGGN